MLTLLGGAIIHTFAAHKGLVCMMTTTALADGTRGVHCCCGHGFQLLPSSISAMVRPKISSCTKHVAARHVAIRAHHGEAAASEREQVTMVRAGHGTLLVTQRRTCGRILVLMAHTHAAQHGAHQPSATAYQSSRRY